MPESNPLPPTRVLARNPWGAFGAKKDIQRTDLWTLDLQTVMNQLDAQFKLQSVSRGRYPALFESIFYAQSVQLPEIKVNAEAIKRESGRPYYMPEWDEPFGQVVVTFLVDVPDIEESKLVNILTDWRRLVRIGRGDFSSFNKFDGTPDLAISLFTGDKTKNFEFRFDIPLNLYRGATTAELEGSLDDSILASNSPFEDKGSKLKLSAQYTLIRCWLSSFQFEALSYENSKGWIVQAFFYPEEIRTVRLLTRAPQ